MTGRDRYDGPERREYPGVEDELAEVKERQDSLERRLVDVENKTSDEAIAKRRAEAIEAVYNSVYQEVGKNVIRALVWASGLGGSALFAWLAATGQIKL